MVETETLETDAVARRVALVGEIRPPTPRSGDELDRVVHDRVGDEALAGECCIVARRPARAAAPFDRDEARRARRFGFRERRQVSGMFRIRMLALTWFFEFRFQSIPLSCAGIAAERTASLRLPMPRIYLEKTWIAGATPPKVSKKGKLWSFSREPDKAADDHI